MNARANTLKLHDTPLTRSTLLAHVPHNTLPHQPRKAFIMVMTRTMRDAVYVTTPTSSTASLTIHQHDTELTRVAAALSSP